MTERRKAGKEERKKREDFPILHPQGRRIISIWVSLESNGFAHSIWDPSIETATEEPPQPPAMEAAAAVATGRERESPLDPSVRARSAARPLRPLSLPLPLPQCPNAVPYFFFFLQQSIDEGAASAEFVRGQRGKTLQES